MRICSLQDGGDNELGLEDRRNVFEGVDDEVDLVGREGGFELGRPESFGLEEVEGLGSGRDERKEGGGKERSAAEISKEGREG